MQTQAVGARTHRPAIIRNLLPMTHTDNQMFYAQVREQIQTRFNLATEDINSLARGRVSYIGDVIGAAASALEVHGAKAIPTLRAAVEELDLLARSGPVPEVQTINRVLQAYRLPLIPDRLRSRMANDAVRAIEIVLNKVGTQLEAWVSAQHTLTMPWGNVGSYLSPDDEVRAYDLNCWLKRIHHCRWSAKARTYLSAIAEAPYAVGAVKDSSDWQLSTRFAPTIPGADVQEDCRTLLAALAEYDAGLAIA